MIIFQKFSSFYIICWCFQCYFCTFLVNNSYFSNNCLSFFNEMEFAYKLPQLEYKILCMLNPPLLSRLRTFPSHSECIGTPGTNSLMSTCLYQRYSVFYFYQQFTTFYWFVYSNILIYQFMFIYLLKMNSRVISSFNFCE